MAKEKKIYTHEAIGGISTGEGARESSAELVKNMIRAHGENRKRNGHHNICTLTDEGLNGLRINGIYDYSYVDENGESINQKIVHAKDRLFKLDEGFGSPQEIDLPEGITLKDERSQAFCASECLWIVGAGGLLIYDGTSIKSAYEDERAYVPSTSVFLKNEGLRAGEGSNLLTKKRINTFIGTSNFREYGTLNTFVLDEKIEYETPFLLEIKIRTRTTEKEPDETTSSYIGVDSLGREVDKIVTLRYKREKIKERVHYFLAEPITDESGNIINIKIDDEVRTFDRLAFGLTVKNGREISVAVDTTPPVKGESNIRIEYITEDSGEKSYLDGAKIAALANGDKGGEIMLLNFGDNKIYFTDEKKGFFYLPSNNKISLGADGETVSAIIKLSDNLVGAFTKNSFYRIKFTSTNDDGYEMISSTDLIGAYSQFSSAVVNYDCLVFNALGVYGVSEYRSGTNVFSCLKPRSTRIDTMLKKYSKSERENAQAISYDSRYYLFIGGDAYIADTRRRFKDEGASSDSYEYEWWFWDNCNLRIAYSDGVSLFFGTEGGQIRKFGDEFCDVEIKEYSSDGLSLLLKEVQAHTEFIVPELENINFDIATAHLSSHKRILSRRAVYENGTLYFADDDLFFDDGSVKVYDSDVLDIYSKAGLLVTSVDAKGIDLVFKSLEINNTAGFENGYAYDIFISCPDGYEYETVQGENGVILLLNGEKIKVRNEDFTLVIKEKSPIECIYKSNPICFDELNKKKTIYKLFIKPSRGAMGSLEVHLETEKSTLERNLFLAESISFDSLSFDEISLNAPFDRSYKLPVFLRDFEYITFEIKSKSTKDFGLKNVSFLVSKSEKANN